MCACFPAPALARVPTPISPRSRTSLLYAEPGGRLLRLRRELAVMLSRSRGLAVTPDNLMVTRSIEQAIDLVARALLAPGDVVVVESFGYPPAWNVLKLAGAHLVPLPLDDDGLDVGALEQLLSQLTVRAVLLTPHHSFDDRLCRRAALRLANSRCVACDHRGTTTTTNHYAASRCCRSPPAPVAPMIYVGSLANLPHRNQHGLVAAPPLVLSARAARSQ
jgi:GntR family transcriptional regulator/MocR family aminotransferase